MEQKTALAAESKSVLDSWVRYEGQVKQRQQQELAQSIIAKIEKELENPKVLDQILKQSVADVERKCFLMLVLSCESNGKLISIQALLPRRLRYHHVTGWCEVEPRDGRCVNREEDMRWPCIIKFLICDPNLFWSFSRACHPPIKSTPLTMSCSARKAAYSHCHDWIIATLQCLQYLRQQYLNAFSLPKTRLWH